VKKRLVTGGGHTLAVIASETPVITDARSALDLMATLRYEDGCDGLVLPKEAIAGDFFRLSTGLAGEILQKFVNYRMKLAIVGDFSGYQSKPLHDFITECNRGNAIFFVPDEAAAIDRLTGTREVTG